MDRSRLVALSLAAALLIGACTSGAPSAAPSTGPTAVASTTAPAASAPVTPPPAATTPAATTPPPNAQATDKVTIVNFAFNPSAITVKAGTTVTWTNTGRSHTVTADDGSFDSGVITTGATFAMAFKQAGTYAYHCSIHPSMVGQVLVTP